MQQRTRKTKIKNGTRKTKIEKSVLECAMGVLQPYGEQQSEAAIINLRGNSGLYRIFITAITENNIKGLPEQILQYTNEITTEEHLFLLPIIMAFLLYKKDKLTTNNDPYTTECYYPC